MAIKIWLPLMITLLLLAACAGQGATVETEPPTPLPEDPLASPLPGGGEEPPPNPYAPGKGDESMKRGEVTITSQEILTQESPPAQFQLQVSGFLPTPCHGLRVVIDDPDEQNQIHVQMFSLVDPNTACAQVLEPFEASIPLGGYAPGSYTVFVNGEEVGEIMSGSSAKITSGHPYQETNLCRTRC